MGTGSGGYGIYFLNGAHNGTILNNTLGNQLRGVYLRNVRGNLVERNNFSFYCMNCVAIYTIRALVNTITLDTMVGTNETNHGIYILHGSDYNLVTYNTALLDIGLGVSIHNTTGNIFIKNS